MLQRSLSHLRKTGATAAKAHNLHFNQDTTSYQMRSTPGGGAVIAWTKRTASDGEGSEVSILGAELDAHGAVLKGGEMIFTKTGKSENIVSKGNEDPREIIRSFVGLPIPHELQKINFQVNSESISPESLLKAKLASK